MTDRTVSVRLRMLVRDYVSGSNDASRATRQLREAQVQLGHTSRKTGDDLTKSAKDVQVWGEGVRRASLITTAAALGAGGALQYLAPAAVAAGAGVGTLPGILGGAAAAMGTLKVSTIGVSDATKELFKTDDPYARLAPSARALVNEVGRLKPQLLAAQQSLQGATFASAAGNLDRLAKVTLPEVSRQVLVLADDWSEAWTAITDAATDPTVLNAFGTVTASTDRFLDQVNRRIQPFAQSLGMLAMSADPLARVIGDRLVGAIDGFIGGIQRARQSGSLDDFFRSGAESAGALLSIAGDLLTITGQVVSAANRQNSAIASTASALDAYVASGRSAEDIAGIVDTVTTAYEGLSEVLGPLAQIARDALADPGTREAVATLFDILAAGSQTLKIVFDLFQMLPDEAQSFALAALGLTLAMKKVSEAAATMGTTVSAAATKLAGLGVAGQTAGRALTGFVGAAGRALNVLLALQLVGVVFEQFEPAAANVDALTDSVERFAKTGDVSGELARVFGENLDSLNKAAGAAASDGFIAKVGRSIESVIPAVKSLNEIFQGGSFLGSVERFQALDAAISEYAQRTNDTTGTTEAWNRVLAQSGLNADELAKLLPRTTGELTRLQDRAHGSESAVGALSQRTKLLSGSMDKAVLSGRSLIDMFNEINGKTIAFADAEIQAEAKVDDLTKSLKENGKALNKQGTDFDTNTAKGRENKQNVLELITAGAKAADAKYQETNSIDAANAVYNEYIDRLRKTLHNAKLTDAQIDRLIATYGQMPAAKSTDIEAPGAVTAKNQVGEVIYKIRQLPDGRVVVVGVRTAEAMREMRAAKAVLDSFRDRHFTITGQVRWINSGSQAGSLKVPGGTQLKNRWGGIHIPTAMAGGGVMQANVYPASNPPLMQFAEPQTGGEAYIPRRGDRRRNLAILAEAASWNNAQVIAMAGGGITAAAAGLVQYAPSSSTSTRTRGTALESIDAAISARDAIARLNAALKENGRSFSLSTAKGRENYSTLIAAVKAAQDAAQAKYAETGSVKAANAAYDAHIAALRRALAQQKVSAATIAALTRQMGRPSYDLPAPAVPVGSSRNIAAAEGRIRAEGALADLVDHFSLTKPVFDIKDATGRENLTELFGYLKAAQDAAQAVLEQTGNRKAASGVYESYIARLRAALGGAGAGKGLIDSLIAQYGQAVLTPNRIGGVYGPMALSQGGMWGPGSTLYGFAERGTGGELFLPRLGSRQRGEDILSVGAGWYGGRFVPAGRDSGSPTTIHNTLTVNGGQQRLTLADLQGLLRQMDARARVGRKN